MIDPQPSMPTWWIIVRPAIKIVCLTLVAAPGLLTSTQGLVLPPIGYFIMALLALMAGYTLSEMSPGYRPRP